MRNNATAPKLQLNKEVVMQFKKISYRRTAAAGDRRRLFACCDGMSLMSTPSTTTRV